MARRRVVLEDPEKAVPAHLKVGSELMRRDPSAWRRERLLYGQNHHGELLAAGITPLEWTRGSYWGPRR